MPHTTHHTTQLYSLSHTHTQHTTFPFNLPPVEYYTTKLGNTSRYPPASLVLSSVQYCTLSTTTTSLTTHLPPSPAACSHPLILSLSSSSSSSSSPLSFCYLSFSSFSLSRPLLLKLHSYSYYTVSLTYSTSTVSPSPPLSLSTNYPSRTLPSISQTLTSERSTLEDPVQYTVPAPSETSLAGHSILYSRHLSLRQSYLHRQFHKHLVDCHHEPSLMR